MGGENDDGGGGVVVAWAVGGVLIENKQATLVEALADQSHQKTFAALQTHLALLVRYYSPLLLCMETGCLDNRTALMQAMLFKAAENGPWAHRRRASVQCRVEMHRLWGRMPPSNEDAQTVGTHATRQ